MICVACGDTGVASNGRPCEPCLKAGRVRGVGNAYVLRPLVRTETRTERNMRELKELLRLMAAQDAPPPTEEQLAEQEKASKIAELRRLGAEIQELQHGP